MHAFLLFTLWSVAILALQCSWHCLYSSLCHIFSKLMPPFLSKDASPSSLDVAWEEAHKSKKATKTRQLVRKSTEAQVQKAITDSLKGMRPEEIDGNRDEHGKTLRDVVTERKRLNREDPHKFPCGLKFYQEVRNKFQTKDRPIDHLVSDDTDGAISSSMLQAMVIYVQEEWQQGSPRWLHGPARGGLQGRGGWHPSLGTRAEAPCQY